MTAIDEYLKNVTPDQKVELERVRSIATRLIPEPEEVISYGMPTIKYKGKYVIYFAAFKEHMGIYGGIISSFHDKLDGYKKSKGAVQFTADHPIPTDVIEGIVKQRLKEIAQA